jgi:hypothetical protein
MREKGGFIMVYKMLYGIVCYAYANGLRSLVKKAIDDPDTDWDDMAISILDKIFNYSE